ncbi:MAG: PepSY domain-containing protein [Winogradskyella sp.]|uniref:PepSY domain-containing protein n=1 Tax=Winogradskyella sp. TaxID=1883156 RepID=UPI0025EE9C3B|nr:PepSY domain-containing protein [Winogradskyella sp.]NRB58693.1 PepSY domain-containing protein [Winogradskyella sp.]
MTISIWRYSHLLLAISSAVFIFIATITGIILTFEPISSQLQPFAVDRNISLAETLHVLETEYDEVITLTVDENKFISASVITKEGKSETFYIDPKTGENIGQLIKKAPIFEFATNLHRSLFLKSTGRFLVGLFSFFLLLIAITGVKLVLKRQGGIKRFFSKVVKENFEQYYHVVFGRYALIPILIVTLSGVYLSLEKFDALPSDRIIQIANEDDTVLEKKNIQDFEIFQDIDLSQLKSVEFPFSEDEEDYFIIELNDKELFVNQYTGKIISQGQKPLVVLLSALSLKLHTGQGSIFWAIILLLTCLSILFFMYSGFAMTLKRRKDKTKIKNRTGIDEAEYIILLGSETGNTKRFVKQFSEALSEVGNSVFVDQLNNYTSYKNAQQLIVFTSTYGEGDAPSNATQFIKLLGNVKQSQKLKYSVVGFGSLMYPDFCKYAIEVNEHLHMSPNFEQHLELFKINNQSTEAFKTWISNWNRASQQQIKIKSTKPVVNTQKLKDFEVINNTTLNVDDTFLLQLKPYKKQKFQSGDLLALYPEEDHVERLYSIGKIGERIVLSIKKHEFGLCSTQLSKLQKNHTIKAKLKRNLDFHFPTYAKEVIMIANGTGIAPFLGMISGNIGIKKHLFWGGRTKASSELYSEYIKKALAEDHLTSFHAAYSQEEKHKVYVQDLILKNKSIFVNALKNEGVIMICGAIAMQNRVLEILGEFTIKELKAPLSVLENNEQIKVDCY